MFGRIVAAVALWCGDAAWLCHLVLSCVCCLQLPAYYPSPEEVADPALYAANVRQYMVSAWWQPGWGHEGPVCPMTQACAGYMLSNGAGGVHLA